jgi:hypothetical protein
VTGPDVKQISPAASRNSGHPAFDSGAAEYDHADFVRLLKALDHKSS